MKKNSSTRTLVAVLDGIRSVHNVGSIFRTADAAGVSGVYLCGVTPSPADRFGRTRSDFKKVSLGAENNVVWEAYKHTSRCVRHLRDNGFFVCALEQHTRSKNIYVAGSVPRSARKNSDLKLRL